MVNNARQRPKTYADDSADAGNDYSKSGAKSTTGTASDMDAEKRNDKWRMEHLHQCKHCLAFPTNHFESECIEKIQPCFRCGARTHLRKDCPKPRGDPGVPKVSGQLNSKERRQLAYIETKSNKDGSAMWALERDRIASGHYDKRQTPKTKTEAELQREAAADAKQKRANRIAAKVAKQKELDKAVKYEKDMFLAGLGKKPKPKKLDSSHPEIDAKTQFQKSTPVAAKLAILAPFAPVKEALSES